MQPTNQRSFGALTCSLLPASLGSRSVSPDDNPEALEEPPRQLSLVPIGQALDSPILLVALGYFTFLLSQGIVCFQDSCNVCQCEGLVGTRLIAL